MMIGTLAPHSLIVASLTSFGSLLRCQLREALSDQPPSITAAPSTHSLYPTLFLFIEYVCLLTLCPEACRYDTYFVLFPPVTLSPRKIEQMVSIHVHHRVKRWVRALVV